MRRTALRGRARPVLVVGVAVLLVTTTLASVPLAAATPPESEPNDSQENAQSIQTGATVDGAIESNGDTDWYSFQADRGETINVTVSGGADGTNTVKLFGKTQRGGSDVSDETVSVGTTARYTGTYYVQVSKDFYASQGADYTLDVDTYRTDAFEPNENRSMATQLFENPFTPTEAQLSIGDADFFTYRFDAGRTVRLAATLPADSEDHDLSIYRPGETNAANRSVVDSGASASVTYTTQSAGAHEIAVLRGAYGGPGAYNATVTVDGEPIGPPNDRFERPNPPIGNQDRASATEVGSGSYADLGMVDDDRDVFAVDLSAGERLGASIAFNHTENDLALALANDAGTTVRSANSSTDGERVAYTAPGAGTYYLTVSGEAGAAAHYTLDLDVIQEVDVTVGAGSDTLSPGNTTTYPVNVTSVSAGLSTANLSLESTNASAVAIQSVGAAATGSVNATVAADNGSVTANVTGLDPASGGVVTVARLTVAAVENGSATLTGSATVATDSGFDYPIRSVQNTTVTVAPPGSLEHESGVSMRLFTAVAGSDGELDRTDVIAMVGAYVRSQPVDGVAVTRADVLALVQYYVLNA